MYRIILIYSILIKESVNRSQDTLYFAIVAKIDFAMITRKKKANRESKKVLRALLIFKRYICTYVQFSLLLYMSNEINTLHCREEITHSTSDYHVVTYVIVIAEITKIRINARLGLQSNLASSLRE